MCPVQWPLSLTYIFKVIQPIKLLKYNTYCRVRSTAPRVLDRFLPHLAQMIASMRRCVVHNDLWNWPMSSRSFSHNVWIKLLKHGTSCHVRSTACTDMDGFFPYHYSDVIMSAMASQITGAFFVCSTVWSGADQWKHQSSSSLAFGMRKRRWPVDTPHKGPVTRKCIH